MLKNLNGLQWDKTGGSMGWGAFVAAILAMTTLLGGCFVYIGGGEGEIRLRTSDGSIRIREK